MQLTAKQAEVILNKSRFKVLNWGRRSGKTTVFAYEALGTALTIPNAHITYYAQTFGDARDIAWNIFLEVFGEAVVSKNETLLEIKVQNLKGGTSLISLKGWESVYQTGKGRGTENDLILADEVAFCRGFMEFYDKVLAPTLLTTKGRAVFGSTPNGFNDFYTLTERAQANADWFYSHATSYDNEANDPVEIERIRSEISEDRFAQEYLADFRKLEGLVFKEFDRTRHTYDTDIDVFDEYIAGVDFGYKNPCAVIHIKRDGDDNYYVTEEWYKTERSEEQIADYVKSCNFNRVYPDPENPSAISLLNEKGIAVIEVTKGKGSIKSGIDKLHLLFKQNKLKIHVSCKNLIWELENYRYPDSRPNHNDDENPIKENDHACFTSDTIIETFGGDILYQQKTGTKDVYEFMDSKVTSDHPYLTQRGFVRLDALRHSDKIVLWKNKLLMEYHLDGTQTLIVVNFVTILYLLQRNLQAIKLNAYTGMYGKSIMVQFLMVFIFTIKTTTHLITIYLTSNWSQAKNTTQNIMMRCYQNGKQILLRLLKKQANGQKPQKGRFFVQEWVRKMQDFFLVTKSRETAISVEKNILRKQKQESSVTIIAKLKHCGQEDVYATATTSGVFLANGVLVSNCDALRYALMTNRADNVIPPHIVAANYWEKRRNNSFNTR